MEGKCLFLGQSKIGTQVTKTFMSRQEGGYDIAEGEEPLSGSNPRKDGKTGIVRLRVRIFQWKFTKTAAFQGERDVSLRGQQQIKQVPWKAIGVTICHWDFS